MPSATAFTPVWNSALIALRQKTKMKKSNASSDQPASEAMNARRCARVRLVKGANTGDSGRRRGYFTVAAPTLHATSSCEPVPPEHPIPPMSLPPCTSGIPPREPMTPSSVMT